jgi:chloride channel protein, CIC family
MRVKEMVEFFTTGGARHKTYPVVNEAGRVVALASRSDALAFVNDPQPGEVALGEALGSRQMVIGTPEEPLSRLVERMVQDDSGRAPIVDPETGRLVGLVSRQDLLRIRARQVSEERERSRVLRWGHSPAAVAARGEPGSSRAGAGLSGNWERYHTDHG